jgi:hypothetical protein
VARDYGNRPARQPLRRRDPAAHAVLPRTGHLANLELPDVVDALVEEFVASVEPDAALGGRA